MRKLEIAEILDLVEYEKIRGEFRAGIIQLKRPRRIAVGDRLTFIFENRETVRFQVQEMLRAERTVNESEIQIELDVYNELIPGPHELSATLMVEIPELEMVRSELDRLIGIDEHVSLSVGDRECRARFDTKQFEEDRISAVQYVRFPLGEEAARQFCDPGVCVELRVAHANYQASSTIEAASRESLIRDLEEDR